MQTSKEKTFKVVVPILLGNMIEFYDIVLFGIFAPILGQNFYNTADGIMSAISLSYITFAIGFFFRPLGSMYFGYIADIYGRKKALLSSLILMALSTLGIALLPTYEKIGFWATIAVTLFRCMQGFSAGGEYNNAAIYLIEYDQKFKNINSALLVVSGVIGSMIASILYHSVIHNAAPEWMWRIAFALGSCAAIIGFILRFSILETEEFLAIRQDFQSLLKHLVSLVNNQYKELFTAFIVGGFNGLIYYFQFVFLVNYLPSKLFIAVIEANYLNMLALICYAVGVLANGLLANRFGAKNLMVFSCLGYALFLIPITELLFVYSITKLILYQIALSFLSSCFCGVKHVFLAQLFPAKIRSTGVSVGYGFGVAMFGGTAPLILNILSLKCHMYIMIYIIIIAIACYLTIRGKEIKYGT